MAKFVANRDTVDAVRAGCKRERWHADINRKIDNREHWLIYDDHVFKFSAGTVVLRATIDFDGQYRATSYRVFEEKNFL